MIVNNKNFKFVHTRGRPDILSDEDRVTWKKVHDLIRESEIAIEPYDSFYLIDGVLERDSNYMGAGYKYSLAFETLHHMNTFVEEVDKLLQP